MDNDYHCIAQSWYDAYKEVIIVSLSHAVVKPHAVMVKIIYTSVTGAAMLAIGITVTITVLAEQDLIVLWRKDHVFIIPWPFIIVHHPIRRVFYRWNCTSYYHDRPEDYIED